MSFAVTVGATCQVHVPQVRRLNGGYAANLDTALGHETNTHVRMRVFKAARLSLLVCVSLLCFSPQRSDVACENCRLVLNPFSFYAFCIGRFSVRKGQCEYAWYRLVPPCKCNIDGGCCKNDAVCTLLAQSVRGSPPALPGVFLSMPAPSPPFRPSECPHVPPPPPPPEPAPAPPPPLAEGLCWLGTCAVHHCWYMHQHRPVTSCL